MFLGDGEESEQMIEGVRDYKLFLFFCRQTHSLCHQSSVKVIVQRARDSVSFVSYAILPHARAKGVMRKLKIVYRWDGVLGNRILTGTKTSEKENEETISLSCEQHLEQHSLQQHVG